jgi:hypothetical protein
VAIGSGGAGNVQALISVVRGLFLPTNGAESRFLSRNRSAPVVAALGTSLHSAHTAQVEVWNGAPSRRDPTDIASSRTLPECDPKQQFLDGNLIRDTQPSNITTVEKR